MAGLTKATPTSEFNGQGCIIVFDEVTDYTTATVTSITGAGFDVGQVYQGSTTWTGEDPSFEDELDEQGDVIVSNPTKGTFGFDFEMADFSAEKFKTFLRGKEITYTGSSTGVFKSTGVQKAVATTEDMPIITRPIALVNDECNKALFFPKARILTGPGMENKLFVLKSVVKAQDCNTDTLGTFMLIDKFELNYAVKTGENV